MKEHGFTLIELLVAIVMIGVLSTIGITMINPLEQIKKGRDAERKHDLNKLPLIMEAYISDFKRYPEAQGGLIKGVPWGKPWEGYLAKLPKDPLPQQDYSYEVAEDGSWYRLCARLERCNDPQRIPEAECSSYNYSISSPNIPISPCGEPTPAPTLPPAPSTPAPISISPNNTPTPTPTNTPTPTHLPTATPTPLPKRVFVTATTYKGDLGSWLGADTKCRDSARAANLGNQWVAWLSTPSVSAINRINEGKYVKMDINGTLIANSKADLIDGKIESPIDTTEYGIQQTSSPYYVWTGTKTDGNPSQSTCDDWKLKDGSLGDIGHNLGKEGNWTALASSTCFSSFRLYCFEK